MSSLIHVFEKPYEHEGVFIDSHFQAAAHIVCAVQDNHLGSFVEQYLSCSSSFKELRRCMPTRTPEVLSGYQKNPRKSDLGRVSSEIGNVGVALPIGTYLFHGGFWPKGWESIKRTTAPFSTSFCPQVALRNAEHRGKAYDSGEVHIFVCRVVNPATKAFVFRHKGTRMGHEKEVLFKSGVELVLRNKVLICSDYRVSKVVSGTSQSEKTVPAYVLEIDIS
ncbi:hypothetical protein E4656_06500 [Natronospirillum operosum]|uniref:ADP ribosyltransferase domain-containing protein n=1 Tax=Natronospirillum operosum TaxID=2759953 RepID=A0A4Z0WFB2_9GAMM|nr:hypothetical protein [Natronospirillum operosum]TGG93841.1 hypothetical protein E4656_06500 [Natronospirillum operosum]